MQGLWPLPAGGFFLLRSSALWAVPLSQSSPLKGRGLLTLSCLLASLRNSAKPLRQLHQPVEARFW